MAEVEATFVAPSETRLETATRRLPQQLVRAVLDRLLSGEFEPDVPVRQDVLAADLGVSKTPLREALARLEQEGLLTLRVNRGYFVRPMTAGEMEEVFALRLSLEPTALAVAASHATEADHRLAAGILARVEDAARRSEGVNALNRAFYASLIRPSGRPVTSHILARLQVLSDRYVRKHLEALSQGKRATEERRQLLLSWVTRDSEGIAALARACIGKTLSDLRRQLGAQSD